MPRSLLALLFVPLFFTACSSNNVTVDGDLQRYFAAENVKGSFGFFDNGQGHFTIYNLSRYRDSAYQPAGTFDILEALIALQTGIAKDDTSVLFPGLALPYADTPAKSFQAPAMSLKQAFSSSGQEHEAAFSDLARRIGKDTLKKWTDSIHYGKRAPLTSQSDTISVVTRPEITSDEQLGLIKRLYFDQLPFFKRPQQLVRGIMQGEKNSNYELVYKTGQYRSRDGRTIGWVMGWVKENIHLYFFVANLESLEENKDLEKAGLGIVKGILGQWGFFQGKK